MAGEGRQQHCYAYPRPSLTVDAVVVAAPPAEQRQQEQGAKLLLIQRKHDPFAGGWALPGGFVDEGESLEAAAARELQEETGVDPRDVLLTQARGWGPCVTERCTAGVHRGCPAFQERWNAPSASVRPHAACRAQVGAFGDPGRDPRGWCVSVAYAALVPSSELRVQAADDAQVRASDSGLRRQAEVAGRRSAVKKAIPCNPALCPCPTHHTHPTHPPTHRPRRQAAEWFAVDQLPRLAFDHQLIVRTALRHLAGTSQVQGQRPQLAAQLQAAADKLEGPWQQHD